MARRLAQVPSSGVAQRRAQHPVGARAGGRPTEAGGPSPRGQAGAVRKKHAAGAENIVAPKSEVKAEGPAT